MSKTSKGNYYRAKSRDFLVKQGYHVEIMEKYQRIYTKGKVIFNKNDLLGADLVAVSNEDFILVNVITNKTDISKHIKRFKGYPNPQFIKRVLMLWCPRVAIPDIIEVDNEGDVK